MDLSDEAAGLSASLRALRPDPMDPPPVIPTARVFYGVRMGELRRLARQWHRRHPDADPDAVGDLADLLWATGIREEMVLAAVLHGSTAAARSAMHIGRIDRWAPLLDVWETTDQLGMALVGPWVGDGLPATMDVLGDLAKRPSPWVRRLGLATAAWLGREPAVPWSPVEALVLRLAGEREAAIPKAISWVLRSHLTHHRDDVLSLLDRQSAALPAVAVREVRRKAATGVKR